MSKGEGDPFFLPGGSQEVPDHRTLGPGQLDRDLDSDISRLGLILGHLEPAKTASQRGCKQHRHYTHPAMLPALPSNQMMEVVTGDITTLEVDAIVNAANEQLAHGGGVALAIARAGAPQVDEESARWVTDKGPLGPGDVAVTGAGQMPARWVIHVVGPRYREGQDNPGRLAEAVTAALDRAAEIGARSVALPAISAGVFGYPLANATAVIVEAIRTWSADHPGRLERIVLAAFDRAAAEHFEAALQG